jgi:hypothetical protein
MRSTGVSINSMMAPVFSVDALAHRSVATTGPGAERCAKSFHQCFSEMNLPQKSVLHAARPYFGPDRNFHETPVKLPQKAFLPEVPSLYEPSR